ATWSIVPYRTSDRVLAEQPRYRAEDVWNVRCETRIARRKRPVHVLDMREADWEFAYRTHRKGLINERCGANSFLGFDRVGRGGEVHYGSRPLLGNKV